MDWEAPDDSFFWPLIREYRSPDGKDIVESERASCAWLEQNEEEIRIRVHEHGWRHSPKPQWEIELMLRFLNQFIAKDRAFTYLEFGTCFGTTFSMIMSYFENARGRGYEVDPYRFQVSSLIVERIGTAVGFLDRVKLQQSSILDAKLEPDSIDVVFMDTNHRELDDYRFIMHLLDSGALRDDFLFVGDDPTLAGTDDSRKHFIAHHSDSFHIATHEDLNLWWFKEHASMK